MKKYDEKLYRLSHLEVTSGLSPEMFLEGTHLLGRWLFHLHGRQCQRKILKEYIENQG